ncbi:hypothetical protein PA7_02270 [Pseudonocardia asaccharolytica DSM 44247 = NBRC 16224]|uniref:Uncharacterized protein n=1 Tax=Pseudonocardia asaccharolytica DSM 44247 = NBRC 16224 TaxID=1123024 RepID=A0A511CUZ8_9PSEU|nr:hypothetical protein PA7_02270 [Pseudonocardia asaccharolytica DSM 44247 = NBRC 16224]
MNRGVPPTALNARTGELTPPGMALLARSNIWAEACAAGGAGVEGELGDELTATSLAAGRWCGWPGPYRRGAVKNWFDGRR